MSSLYTPPFVSWTWRGDEIVYLRFDGNVPVHDHSRLHAMLPTLAYVSERARRIYLASHAPEGRLVDWFVAQGYPVVYETNAQPTDRFIMTENVRNDPREHASCIHENSHAYAQNLQRDTTHYINDGFGVMHRTDTSVVALAQRYPLRNRSWGFCVARELEVLSPLVDDPHLVVIMGGGKVRDKFEYLEKYMTRARSQQGCLVLVGPGFSPLFHGLTYPMGRTEIFPELRERAERLLGNPSLILPVDYLVTRPDGAVERCHVDRVPDDAVVASIGSETVTQWMNVLSVVQGASQGPILMNCAMGFDEVPATTLTSDELMRQMASLHVRTVFAGGDTVGRAQGLGLCQSSFCSTGGGAALAYVSGGELPGLDVLRSSF